MQLLRLLILTILLLFAPSTSLGGQSVDLSPSAWPAGELDTYAALNLKWGERKPLATGRHGLVAATTTSLAVRAGLEALKQGGTAIDAAITHALAEIVLMAGCCVSHAGRTTLIYYEAATGQVHAMNGGFNTVRGETDPLSIPASTPSGRTALVPGFMAGMEAAHARFGRLPFDALFAPAIYFAEQGFVLDQVIASMIRGRHDVLTRLPEARAVFTKANGELYQAGDEFKQPALAVTLKRVAATGSAYMYTGAWAHKFVAAVRAEGGHMSLDDLAAYEVTWSDPIRGTYRGYELFTPSLPNYGGINAIEALNLLELADLPQYGHYTTSPKALYWFMQVTRVAELMGPLGGSSPVLTDLDFSHRSRLSKDHARVLWNRMQSPDWAEGTGPGAGSRPGAGHSDGVVAVDADGNVAALLQTINTDLWGRTGIFVDGVPISDAAVFQSERIRQIGPGARLPHPGNPMIVFKDGTPFLASAAVGSGLHAATLQSLVNVLDYGMDPKAAVDTAQFLNHQGMAEGEFPEALLAAVRKQGWSPNVGSGDRGAWVGMMFDAKTGRWLGAAPRFYNGRAIGY